VNTVDFYFGHRLKMAASDKKMQLKIKKKETEVKNNELWELISITSSGNSISN
jgi:hypothetical protein